MATSSSTLPPETKTSSLLNSILPPRTLRESNILKYIWGDCLGVGKTGQVFAATECATNRDVAIGGGGRSELGNGSIKLILALLSPT